LAPPAQVDGGRWGVPVSFPKKNPFSKRSDLMLANIPVRGVKVVTAEKDTVRALQKRESWNTLPGFRTQVQKLARNDKREKNHKTREVETKRE
jgi:hypothetical protein